MMLGRDLRDNAHTGNRNLALRINLHSGRNTRHQADTIWHLIDVNMHRHSLRQAHPRKDWIHRGQPRLIRLCVRNVDATGEAADMTVNDLAVTHQLDFCRVSLMDLFEAGFLEISVDPKRICIDYGDYPLTYGGEVADLRQKVRDVAVNWREDAAAIEVHPRLV